MANQVNLLDPLAIVGGVKRQVDTAAAQAKVPAALQPKNVTRLLDPFRLLPGNDAGNARPGMDRTDRTSDERR